MIYLDNAATSFPKPPMVVRAMAGTLQKLGGNPGRSGHALSLCGGRIIQRCRELLAEAFDAPAPENVIFFPIFLLTALSLVLLAYAEHGWMLLLSGFILGVGFGNFFGGSLIKITGSDIPSIALSATSNCFKTTLPFAAKLGKVGDIFLSYSFLAYAAIIIALITAYFFKHTRTGLQLRAVGENPATSDAAGINVGRYKYVSTIVGSVIAGLGGLYYVMDYANGVWSNNGFGDRGWLAIALVIFAVWKPDLGILGSFLFGGLMVVHNYIPNLSFGAQELFMMTPYVVTIIVLVAVSMRRKRENLPPASLGLSYFREDR